MNTNTKKALATAIATAVITALDAFDLGETRVAAPAITKPRAVPAPKGQTVRETAGDTNPDLVEITVSLTATDKRLKLPARMFDAKGVAFINGEKFVAGSDKGRAKVQPSVFDADRGDTVRIMRERGNRWTAIVVGQSKGRKPAIVAAPSAKPAPARIAPKPIMAKPVSTSPKVAVKPKRDNTAEIARLMSTTADKAIRGHELGRENANLPETDARRFLTSRDKKAFNVATNALGIKLADAVKMLNREVFA